MVYGLRRYDVDRCAALIDSSDPANKDIPIVGFMSHKAKIYLVSILTIIPLLSTFLIFVIAGRCLRSYGIHFDELGYVCWRG